MQPWVRESLNRVKFYVPISVEYEDGDRAVLCDTNERLMERTHIIMCRRVGVANSLWTSRENAYTVLFSLISGDSNEPIDTGSNEGK